MTHNRFLYIAFLLLAVAMLPMHTDAQELICSVDINTAQVEGTNTSLFEEFKTAVNDYMNNTKFSSAQFAANEKIQCKMLFTISEVKDNRHFVGDLQIQATRPVYNSSYTTPEINFRDTKIEFDFDNGQTLIHNDSDTWDSQLTGILDFYANLILAMDFDSFAPKGGQPYWDRMGRIVQLGQSSGETGWRAFEDNKNRAAIHAAFTQPSTAALRDITYEYHRRGLDEMSVSPDKGRAAITEAILKLEGVHKADAMSVGLSMFKDAKLDEIVNIYTKASSTERDKVHELLRKLYPTESKRLDLLKKGVNK